MYVCLRQLRQNLRCNSFLSQDIHKFLVQFFLNFFMRRQKI